MSRAKPGRALARVVGKGGRGRRRPPLCRHIGNGMRGRGRRRGLNPVTSAGKAGGAGCAAPRAREVRYRLRPRRDERPALLLRRRAAAGEALSFRLRSRGPGSTVKLVIPVQRLAGSGHVRAWKRSGRTQARGWPAWTRWELVGGDGSAVFAQSYTEKKEWLQNSKLNLANFLHLIKGYSVSCLEKHPWPPCNGIPS
ncbi:uncharacterized protein FYW23_015677 [Sylvia borin]